MEDSQSFSVQFLGLRIETGEPLFRVRNENSSVRSTLHGTEDTGTGRGAGETDIEEALEGAGLSLDSLDQFKLAGRLSEALVRVRQAQPKNWVRNVKTEGLRGFLAHLVRARRAQRSPVA